MERFKSTIKFRSLFHLILVLGFCSIISCMENGDEKRSFKIAEGSASTTLKIFAQQAEVNIIFENNSFESVITHAVEGEMEAGNALHQMLENTGLSYFCDERSRSYAISWDEVNHPSSNNSNSVGNTHSKKQESKRIIR